MKSGVAAGGKKISLVMRQTHIHTTCEINNNVPCQQLQPQMSILSFQNRNRTSLQQNPSHFSRTRTERRRVVVFRWSGTSGEATSFNFDTRKQLFLVSNISSAGHCDPSVSFSNSSIHRNSNTSLCFGVGQIVFFYSHFSRRKHGFKTVAIHSNNLGA